MTKFKAVIFKNKGNLENRKINPDAVFSVRNYKYNVNALQNI